MGQAEATVGVGRPAGFVNFAGWFSVFQERWAALKGVCVLSSAFSMLVHFLKVRFSEELNLTYL